jgi:hypothetical protein
MHKGDVGEGTAKPEDPELQKEKGEFFEVVHRLALPSSRE